MTVRTETSPFAPQQRPSIGPLRTDIHARSCRSIDRCEHSCHVLPVRRLPSTDRVRISQRLVRAFATSASSPSSAPSSSPASSSSSAPSLPSTSASSTAGPSKRGLATRVRLATTLDDGLTLGDFIANNHIDPDRLVTLGNTKQSADPLAVSLLLSVIMRARS